MVMLIAFSLVLMDKKLGYMSRISKTRTGSLLYSTNKKIIITTVISLIILVTLYGIAVPLGINKIFIKTIYNVLGGILIALGLGQEKINRMQV